MAVKLCGAGPVQTPSLSLSLALSLVRRRSDSKGQKVIEQFPLVTAWLMTWVWTALATSATTVYRHTHWQTLARDQVKGWPDNLMPEQDAKKDWIEKLG